MDNTNENTYTEANSKYNTRGCINQSNENGGVRCNAFNANKLDVYNWLKDVPRNVNTFDIVEVRFKNTRKAFFSNVNSLSLSKGDVVAVEASPGHDIGIVSLTGELVYEQMKKYRVNPFSEHKKIYRKAKPADIEKWENSIKREHDIMIEARQIAADLNLDMKIGDVDFQGDGTKAIFYYIADERVDFRELIKVLAERFRIRVEMRQIGARQEAGRIGGIGSCGRELCCSTWMTNFVSVTTNAARLQELSLNPQKLAGQCGKLKCCLNYELETYNDARKDFPGIDVVLETKEGKSYHFKTDVFKRHYWYSFQRDYPSNITQISIDRAIEIIALNKNGKIPDKLKDEVQIDAEKALDFQKVVGQESLDRFDNKKPRKKKRRPNRKNVNRNYRPKSGPRNSGTKPE